MKPKSVTVCFFSHFLQRRNPSAAGSFQRLSWPTFVAFKELITLEIIFLPLCDCSIICAMLSLDAVATSVMETITNLRLSSKCSFWAQPLALGMLIIYLCGKPSSSWWIQLYSCELIKTTQSGSASKWQHRIRGYYEKRFHVVIGRQCLESFRRTSRHCVF